MNAFDAQTVADKHTSAVVSVICDTETECIYLLAYPTMYSCDKKKHDVGKEQKSAVLFPIVLDNIDYDYLFAAYYVKCSIDRKSPNVPNTLPKKM